MGYSVCGTHGHLCCDSCGKCKCDTGGEGVRRIKCPFGYCQADILCRSCQLKHKVDISRSGHILRGCEESHRKFKAREAHEASLLRTGKAVRCSALGVDEPCKCVHVLFRYGDGRTVGRYMDHVVYDCLSLGEPYTVEDYERKAWELGSWVSIAPGEFSDGRVTKGVVL